MRTRKEVYELVERAYNESPHVYSYGAITKRTAPTETRNVFIGGRFEGSKHGNYTVYVVKLRVDGCEIEFSVHNTEAAIKPEHRYGAATNTRGLTFSPDQMYEIILAATFPEEVTTKE